MMNLPNGLLLTLVVASLATGCSTLGAKNGNVEEQRIDAALQALGEAGTDIANDLLFAPLGATFGQQSGQASSAGKRVRLLEQAARAGEALWRRATSVAQSAKPTLDDRPLYWQRLLEKREFQRQCGADEFCQQSLEVFERASRGATDLTFRESTDLRILVTGFDPFSLDKHIDQSNPSGAAVLALDGQRLIGNGRSAEVQAVVFPVRFTDFDQGMVEEIFEPLIAKIDMLITVSMGRSDFDLERFPGLRRSATAPDNLRIRTGASATDPLVPLLNGAPLQGPEFVEFSLPTAAMCNVQTPYRVNDNRNVQTLENGRFAAANVAELANQTSVSGSGGGYLSNEISYRTVRLVQQHNADIAVGHIHTPRISAFDPLAINAIAAQLRAILNGAIGAARE